MLGHLGVNVPLLAAAKAYYDEIAPLVGYEGYHEAFDEVAYRPADGRHGTHLFLYPSEESGEYSRFQTGLQHLAFIVPTRSDVRAVHSRAVALGSTVLHGPAEFPQYPPPFFAAFWLDPFGIKLEAVCHKDAD